MSKNVLILSSSLRKNSNSDALACEFFRGAKEAGHHVEKISLAGKNIRFCIGCLTCQHTQKCVINDDSVEITEKMKKCRCYCAGNACLLLQCKRAAENPVGSWKFSFLL